MNTKVNTQGLSLLTIVSSSLLTMFASMPAAGQTSAGPVLEEVIVTAQKREESLQEIPIAVTAFSAEIMDRRDIGNLSDLDGMVPGMNVANDENSNRVITIRGLGNEANRNRASISSVSFHVDGVFINAPASLTQDFLDVERIEVLRGPQGTVFGQNSTGGAINVITRQPQLDEFNGHVDVQFGNYDHLRTRAYVNVPIHETVAARASFQYMNRDGFTDNLALPGEELGEADNVNGRIQLLWQPLDNFSATFRAQLFDTDTANAAAKNILDPTPDPRDVRHDLAGRFKLQSLAYNLELKWDLPWATIKSITSHQDDETAILRDGDLSDGTFYSPRLDGPDNSANDETWTQEINISSNGEGDMPVDWLVGFFYLSGDFFTETIDFVDNDNDNIAESLGFQTRLFNKRESWSVYAQGTYHFTDDLRLTAGVRYSEDDFSSAAFNFFAVTPTELEAASEKVTGRINVEWDILDNSMFYAGWSRGFKPGGTNPTFGLIVDQVYKAETVDSYEAGIKNRFFDEQVQLNITGYFYDYENMQFQNSDPLPFRGGVDNLAKTEVLGVEIELSALLPNNFRVDASFSYTDAEVTADALVLDNLAASAAQRPLLAMGNSLFSPQVIAARTAAVGNINGNTLAKVPKHIVNVSLTHDLEIAGHGTLSSSIHYTYKDGFQARLFANPLDFVPSRDSIDVGFSYKPNIGNWSVDFIATNIADNDDISTINTDVFGVESSGIIYTQPRQFMMRVGYDF